MDFKAHARKWFYEYVKNAKDEKLNPELKIILMNKHRPIPRVNFFIENMGNELGLAQAHSLKHRKKMYSVKHLKELMFEMTEVFILGIEREVKRRYQSDNARIAEQEKRQHVLDMEATLNGKAQGVFEEMGVIADEKLSEQREAEENQRAQGNGPK